MKQADAETLPDSDAFPGAPHPRFATRLVGHKAAEAEMLSAYRSGRLAHAWMISGGEGIGKATLAWRFARFVLANPDPNARLVQEAQDLDVDPARPAARLLAALAHPDFSLMRREWKLSPSPRRLGTDISVDNVRAAMQVFQMSAAFGGWRVSIVDSAEDLNRSSANALLKVIEEPPPRSLILIVSHRPGQAPPTIRSRCRRLKLDPLTENEIGEIAGALGSPWSEIAADRIAAAARRASGSVREALQRLSPDSANVDTLIDAAIDRLPRPDPRAVVRLAEALANRKADEAYHAFHRDLYDWLARYAAATVTSGERAEALGDLWDEIRKSARDTDELNLERELHVLAVFARIAATAPGGRRAP